MGTSGIVISYLPRAGLGNKLFVWARGQVFADAENLRHIHFPWSHISLGAIMSRRNPFYGRSITGMSAGDVGAVLKCVGRRVIVEPDSAFETEAIRNVSYVFYRNANWRDYFFRLREHRRSLRRAFFDLLSENVKSRARMRNLGVAVHVRRGDFQFLDQTMPFETQGLTQAPIAYFRDVIEAFQGLECLRTLPIWLFSDGNDAELEELLKIPGVRRWRSGNDVLDLIVMSQSKVLIAAPSSTYSMWAAFLGDSVVVHHPAHFHQPVRQDGDGVELCWGQPGAIDLVASKVVENLG